MHPLDIESIFSHHVPSSDRVADRHEEVRAVIKYAASTLMTIVPDSPEKTLAIRKLQEAMMYANSAVAQYQ